MSRRETLLDIKIITDDDCGIYRIGEIDTLVTDKVQEYVQRFGEFGYTEILELSARMSSAALNAITDVRSCANEFAVAAKLGKDLP